jgi:hypothetical protein
MSMLGVTILGFTIAGRELALIGVIVLLVVAGIGWYAYSRRR